MRVPARVVVAVALLLAYTAAMGVLVLAPTRVDGDGMGVYRALAALYGVGLPMWVSYGLVEFAANVLLFAPLGAFGALLLPPRRWWSVALACSALSLAIEGAQALLPPRMPSAWDWAANTLGGLMGAAIVAAWRARPAEPAPKRRAVPVASSSPDTGRDPNACGVPVASTSPDTGRDPNACGVPVASTSPDTGRDPNACGVPAASTSPDTGRDPNACGVPAASTPPDTRRDPNARGVPAASTPPDTRRNLNRR